jgi:GLPGLI family protein
MDKLRFLHSFAYQAATLLILPTLLSNPQALLAQGNEPVTLSVIYSFSHIEDLNHPEQPFEQDMILRIGKTESKYSNYTIESRQRERIMQQAKEGPATVGRVSAGPQVARNIRSISVSELGVRETELYQRLSDNRVVRTYMIGYQDYKMEQPIPKIDWKLLPETKEIGGYVCQKATGRLFGRDYIVWFTLDLPYSFGPWLLSGLPGLILEASDSKNEVRFSFKSFEKVQPGESTATYLNRLISINERNLERAISAFERDPVLYVQSRMSQGSNEQVQMVFVNIDGERFRGAEAIEHFKNYKQRKQKQKYNPLILGK